MDIKPWVFLDKHFDIVPEGYYSFVYLIVNRVTNNRYIGKKLFWFKGKKKVTLKNGKKKSKRCLVESDWKDYFGSSEQFNKDLEQYGKENFDRIILHLCRSKAEASYLEAHEQFRHGVLLSDEYSNGWIMVRVRKDHLVKHRDEIIKSITLAKSS